MRIAAEVREGEEVENGVGAHLSHHRAQKCTLQCLCVPSALRGKRFEPIGLATPRRAMRRNTSRALRYNTLHV